MTSIIFLEEHYRVLRDHLFPGDGKESVAVCLAIPVRHKDQIRLLIKEVHPIPYEKCDRNAQYITWSSADIVDLLDKSEAEDLAVIKIHSHPYGPRAFSRQDDRSDLSLFPAIHEWCGRTIPHCSLIFTEDFILGRSFEPVSGGFKDVEKIFVIGDRLRFFSSKTCNNQTCAFDELTYDIFKTLKIGVVGCSGTGSWIVELLGRNQTGKIVLCDFDILKNPNLPRILNSKLKQLGMNKAQVAAKAVVDMGLGSSIELIEMALQDPKSIEKLKSCDIIIGCVDSVFARHLLNTVCTYYMIPYFDVGVSIEADPNSLVSAAGGFHYLQPGKSSLLSRGVFNGKELADDTFKTLSQDFYKRLKEDGYVHGRKVPRPAVGGINSLASASCFNEIESLILNYLYEDEEGVASKVVCKRSGETFVRKECHYAADALLRKKVGLADKFFEKEKLLLGEEIKKQETAAL